MFLYISFAWCISYFSFADQLKDLVNEFSQDEYEDEKESEIKSDDEKVKNEDYKEKDEEEKEAESTF